MGLIAARCSRERRNTLLSGMNWDEASFTEDQRVGVEWMIDAKVLHVSVIGAGSHWRSIFFKTSVGSSVSSIAMGVGC